MKIQITDFGAVSNAEIDLSKKLIVFCGPNNTGKTYIAYAIYGFLASKPSKLKNLIGKEQMQSFFENQEIEIAINPKEVFQDFEQLIENTNKNIQSIFGISEEDTKKLFPNSKIKINISEEEFIKSIDKIEFDRNIETDNISFSLKKKKNDNKIKVNLKEYNSTEIPIDFVSLIVSISILEIIIKYPIFNSHILPVERNSIYTFSKELSLKRTELFEQIQNYAVNKEFNPFDWLEKRSTRYPQAIRDGLKIAEDLFNYQKKKSDFYEVGELIETEIMDGKISVSKDGEVQFVSDKAKSKKLPIHLTASLVKTLSNLTFYLKHIAKFNDLIIIDEPELNLHPNNQILLTRVFARLINKGFRLLISTHSDYILRELNNLIMLSENSKSIETTAKEFGYTKDEKINSSDVGAYLFKFKKQKVNVIELTVNQDGFDVETIDEVIDKLNQRSQELYYYLKEGKDE